VETRIAALFAQLLGAQSMGVHDDFFADLGGHSLVATQLASAIRHEWAIEFPLRHVFESATVAGLAELVERAAVAGGRGTTIPRRGAPQGNEGREL
jgi:acyl carrier protein